MGPGTASASPGAARTSPIIQRQACSPLGPVTEQEELHSEKTSKNSCLSPPSGQGVRIQRWSFWSCLSRSDLFCDVIHSPTQAPRPWVGSEKLASRRNLAQEPIGALGGVATGVCPMGALGRDRADKRPNHVEGGGAFWAMGTYRSAESCGATGFSGHVSSPATAAVDTVGSMSATAAVRKRAKPASGIGASGEAGKRRRKADSAGAKAKAKTKGGGKMNEEISSDSETESLAPRKTEEEEEELEETAQEKKLRLAKLYLEQLRQQEEEKAEARAFEEDQVAGRLKEEVLEQRGRLQKSVAKEIQAAAPADIRVLRGHQLSVTCLVITPDDSAIFSAAKDCSIIKWSTESGRKLHVIPRAKKGAEGQLPGHSSHVLCMAISSDGKYLASGDRSKLILIWEAESCRHLYTFTGHRDAVSGLAFRRGTHQLFSTSHDRSVKVWNVAENSYVETLFGHQDAVAALDALSRECCVTAGGRDGTVRVWKIPEESQLVFYGHQGSIDCVQLITEEHMVSGADDGSVALWGLSKKRPLALQREAHGLRGEPGLEQPFWVSSVAALLNTDLVATGSHSACVRLWQCGEGFRQLEHLCDIPLVGFINSLKFSSSGDFLVAGVGQEHRLGRWWRIREARNSICIIPLRRAPVSPAAGS